MDALAMEMRKTIAPNVHDHVSYVRKVLTVMSISSMVYVMAVQCDHVQQQQHSVHIRNYR